MSFRAVLIGILGAVLLTGVAYINDEVLRLNRLVSNHLPITVFGGLIVVMMGVNPVLGWLRRGWRFRPAELAAGTALVLAACSIPGSTLMRSFTPAIALPPYHNSLQPGWRKSNLLGYAPPVLMPGGGRYDPEVLSGFLTGRPDPGKYIHLDDVPWHKWRTPLIAWVPMITLIAVCVICMSLIVHRQWSSYERLRYPIADFATRLIAPGLPGTGGSVFRSRAFWAGALVVLIIRVINGLHAWYPEEMIQIPLRFDFWPIARKYPALGKALWSYGLFRPVIYPSVVAFAFLLASDVSLSLGLSQVLLVPLVAMLMAWGVDMSEGYMAGGPVAWQRFGAYLGTGVLLAYMGRRYYGQVLRSALTLRARGAVEAHATWACRIFLAAFAAVVVLFIGLGLDWLPAILLAGMILLTFLVVARINVETGLFFIQTRWQAVSILLGLFGATALGPKGLVIAAMLCMVLAIGTRTSLMPFVANSLKVCENVGVRPGRVGAGAAGIFALGLAVAVTATLWAGYNFGTPRDSWSFYRVPTMPFRLADTVVTDLKLSGELERAEEMSSWQRLGHIRPNRRVLWSAGIGVVLVVTVSVLRLRVSWWPLHPVVFLVWGTWGISLFSHSFLLGWAIKVLLTKLGGGQKYRQVLPFMIGAIVGDLLGGLIFMIVGASYFGLTGRIPEPYHIFAP